MGRLAWIGMFTALTAGAAAASCIPDFEFADETTAQDGGQDGGQGGGQDAGLDGPVVPCGMDGGDCNPGDVCCYHTTYANCDMCAPTSDCESSPQCEDGGTYAVFFCNNTEDCPTGKQCCLTYTGAKVALAPQGSQCQPTCTANQLALCDLDGGCAPLPPDAGADAGEPTCHGIGYPGYRVCY